jgi:thiol:disulfide interchange protein
MKALKPFWILLGALVVLVSVSLVRSRLEGREIIPWRTDYQAAKVEAEKGNKPLFLYFTANWCEPCQSLKHTTWADAGVEKALREYVPVKIDVDENPDLVRQYPSDGIPHFVVVGGDGKPVREMVGAMDVGEFLGWLKGS